MALKTKSISSFNASDWTKKWISSAAFRPVSYIISFYCIQSIAIQLQSSLLHLPKVLCFSYICMHLCSCTVD